MSFHQRIDSADRGPSVPSKRAPRASVSLVCEVRQGTRPWKRVKLEDISQTGFSLAAFPLATPDLPLRIRIPGMQLLSAELRWSDGKVIGCAFAEPLHVAVFEHIVRTAQG